MPFSTTIDPFFWPLSTAEPRSTFLSSRKYDYDDDYWTIPRTISIYWPTLNGTFERILNDETRHLERKLSNSIINNKNLNDDSLFKFNCDASDYQPGEIDIKIDGDELIINAEHKKEDQNQLIQHSFKRCIKLPKNIKKETIECNIDSKGQLNIIAELIKPEQQKQPKTIKIPINFVGEKSIEIEKAKEAEKKDEKKEVEGEEKKM